MKQFEGYIKNKVGDSKVLLAGGGDKSLGEFLGSLNWDSENRKLQYKASNASSWSDLVTFGARAMDSTAYLPLSGGTLTNSDSVLTIKSNTAESWIYFYNTVNGTASAVASSGYYSGLAFIANEKGGYARIGVKDDGTPVYRSGAAATDYTLLHSGNWSSYCAAASHTHDYIPIGGAVVSDIGSRVGWGTLAGDSYTPMLLILSPRISGDYGCFYMAAKPATATNDGGTGVCVQIDGYFYLNGGAYKVVDSNSILNYYWANVKISDQTNSATTPTFGNTTINGTVSASQTFISGAYLASTDITAIPALSAIALQFGTGNATGANTWIWRLKWASANYGLFFNDTNDTLYWVGGSTSRMSLDTNTGWVTVLNLKLGEINKKSTVDSSTPIATWINNDSRLGFDYISGSQLTVGYASQLATSRSLWGNSFNGTSDISGTIRLSFGSLVIIGTQNNNTSSTTSYISAGSGYSASSGRYGVKVLACDLTDCLSGLGQDLSGRGGYDFCVVGCNSSSDYGFITFVTHKVNSTSYRWIGGFYDSGGSVTWTVRGDSYSSNYYTTSDRSKKTNISQFSEHISKFTLKETDKDAYGVIAQEVPEMFRNGKEGEMTVNYNSVLSYYIGCLENKVKELEEKISKLENE